MLNAEIFAFGTPNTKTYALSLAKYQIVLQHATEVKKLLPSSQFALFSLIPFSFLFSFFYLLSSPSQIISTLSCPHPSSLLPLSPWLWFFFFLVVVVAVVGLRSMTIGVWVLFMRLRSMIGSCFCSTSGFRSVVKIDEPPPMVVGLFVFCLFYLFLVLYIYIYIYLYLFFSSRIESLSIGGFRWMVVEGRGGDGQWWWDVGGDG